MVSTTLNRHLITIPSSGTLGAAWLQSLCILSLCFAERLRQAVAQGGETCFVFAFTSSISDQVAARLY